MVCNHLIIKWGEEINYIQIIKYKQYVTYNKKLKVTWNVHYEKIILDFKHFTQNEMIITFHLP